MGGLIMHEYSSANTSLRQVPRLHRILVEKNLFNSINFDNGAGKFLDATEFLAENGVLNVRYDKYNLPDDINNNAKQYSGMCYTSTVANVLNVIDSETAQLRVLKNSYDMLRTGGSIFISVYEGNKSGIGKNTKKDCWQNNKRLVDYLDTVKKVFPNASIYNNMICGIKD